MAIDPIELTDAAKFGKLVRDWVFGVVKRPTTNQEFRDATHDCLKIPARITKDPEYPQWTLDNLVIRLPAKELLQQSENNERNNTQPYVLEPFYQDIVDRTLKGLPALYSRVGDYTRAQCG